MIPALHRAADGLQTVAATRVEVIVLVLLERLWRHAKPFLSGGLRR
jgi:hypothetical protein